MPLQETFSTPYASVAFISNDSEDDGIKEDATESQDDDRELAVDI